MRLQIQVLSLLVMVIWSFSSDAACTTAFKSHLRGGPSTNSSIVKSLPKYSPLEILEDQSTWLKVKGYKFEGWIFHTLIDKDLNCMTFKSTINPFCLSKQGQAVRPIVYDEGFLVVKKEIGCNLVKDRYGKKIWMSNSSVWPSSESLKILIN